jgi:hypothetical protein
MKELANFRVNSVRGKGLCVELRSNQPKIFSVDIKVKKHAFFID